MIFSSIEFIFFFLPLFLFANLFTRFKKLFIILFSIFFMYVAEGYFIFILSLIAFVNYILARFVEKKSFLFFGIIFNLSFLIFYKYLNFLNEIFLFTNEYFDVLIPLGISFITFHTISYQVDVHRKKITFEKNFFDFYLFIFMFPQVIAGPITRYSNIYKKIKNLSNRYFKLGIYYFIIGLFQKLIIANHLGEYVDEIYKYPIQFISSVDSYVVSLLYVLQLYYDFSGYSHMAIGLGYIIGVKLPKNFFFPLESYSISEFWKRWHISLSSFIRDYLFIPINKLLNIGPHVKNNYYYLSIFICFLLSGLWHGPNYTFIVWGIIHAFFVILEKFFKFENRRNILTKIYFISVLSISFIFFRSNNITQAFELIEKLFILNNLENYLILKYLNVKFIIILFLSVLFSQNTTIFKLRIMHKKISKSFVGHFILFILIFLLLCELLITTYNPFIYFKF